MTQVTYEDIDDNGETPSEELNKMMKKALEPKTDLQVLLLGLSGAKRFSTVAERNAWKKMEADALGADDDSRVHKAWLEDCISRVRWQITKYKRVISYKRAIQYAKDEHEMEQWKIKHRDRILRKKTAKELAGEVGVPTGDELTKAYEE
jgi:3-methyladenine DNA glycosylase AlkC